MSAWAIAILSLVGVALSAALQFWLVRAATREHDADTSCSQAYADYLRAGAAEAHACSVDGLYDARRNAADATDRIAVYGSAKLVAGLARFTEAGFTLSDGSAAREIASLVPTMRAGGDAIYNRELELLLLGEARQGAAHAGVSDRN